MPTTEWEKLRRITEGDREATAWLYDAFAPRLLRRLARRYGDLDAEELVQDAFLLCLRDDAALLRRALDRLPPETTGPARIERFLWDQACGLATNRRRSALHRRVVQLEPRPRRSAEPGPERRQVARDVLEQLDRCLGGSGSRVHLYYKLRYVDGLKPREIARATGWSSRATYKLKQRLDEAVRRCAAELGLEAE